MDNRARWIAVSVDMLEHKILQGEPYSRRDAWLWLIANAAWKDHQMRTRGGVVTLRRGEVLAGLEHLSKTWDWSVKKVRNFLRDLIAADMIEKGQARSQYATAYLLTKYESYQTASPADERIGASERQAKGKRGAHEGQHSRRDTKDTNISLLPSSDAVASAFAAYNSMAAANGLPKASKLTADRAKEIQRRLAEFGPDGWQRALDNIPRSPHLMGENDRGWKCDIDFLINPKKFTRVHDGGYLGRRTSVNGSAISSGSVGNAINAIMGVQLS